ncbi:Protein CBG16319 [Caenorhabditis briggsae]|uniref:Uncharacterized protein n=2 Tax=Caenorhabditis briggsae TaxID=6238 RepID=A0AAE9CSK6_CAEBR|nr:Protein CBG16319 [Caenorhabditis briggsae]ULT79761.1 hypothetical protein L3Y34_010376 [Caenorhabditis briggsae]CAP34135.2 Protein CBG16319 [Caenorhabditis briggsae]
MYHIPSSLPLTISTDDFIYEDQNKFRNVDASSSKKIRKSAFRLWCAVHQEQFYRKYSNLNSSDIEIKMKTFWRHHTTFEEKQVYFDEEEQWKKEEGPLLTKPRLPAKIIFDAKEVSVSGYRLWCLDNIHRFERKYSKIEIETKMKTYWRHHTSSDEKEEYHEKAAKLKESKDYQSYIPPKAKRAKVDEECEWQAKPISATSSTDSFLSHAEEISTSEQPTTSTEASTEKENGLPPRYDTKSLRSRYSHSYLTTPACYAENPRRGAGEGPVNYANDSTLPIYF